MLDGTPAMKYRSLALFFRSEAMGRFDSLAKQRMTVTCTNRPGRYAT